MDDAFEIIERNEPDVGRSNEVDHRVHLKELLNFLGEEKLTVEQEDIDFNRDVNSATQKVEVKQRLIENYFCEEKQENDKDHEEKELVITPPPDSNDWNSNPFERFDHFSFKSGSYPPHSMTASVMLSAPLEKLVEPRGLPRQNSLPMLIREDKKYHITSPRPVRRSQSTPEQSAATIPEVSEDEESPAISPLELPPSGLNLLAPDDQFNASDEPHAQESSSEPQEKEMSRSMTKLEEAKKEFVKQDEDVESSNQTVFNEESSNEEKKGEVLEEENLCVICACTTAIDISPKASHNLAMLNVMALTIYPSFKERKIFIKLTDLVFAMILTTFMFWSFREIQRLRNSLFLCEQTLLDLHSSPKHSNFSFIQGFIN